MNDFLAHRMLATERVTHMTLVADGLASQARINAARAAVKRHRSLRARVSRFITSIRN